MVPPFADVADDDGVGGRLLLMAHGARDGKVDGGARREEGGGRQDLRGLKEAGF